MDERYQLHLGDCLEVLKSLPDGSVDAVITDPPYGISMDKGFGGASGFAGAGKAIHRAQYDGGWDAGRPSQECFHEMLRASRSALIFGGNYFADILPPSKHWVVWDKLNTMPSFGDCELAWTNLARKSVKKVTREYNGLIGKEAHRWHATQKPLDLMRWCVQHMKLPEGAVILDPFMGSGTTGVAALQMGCKFIGCEIEPKYFNIAKHRIEAEARQKTMDFGGPHG